MPWHTFLAFFSALSAGIAAFVGVKFGLKAVMERTTRLEGETADIWDRINATKDEIHKLDTRLTGLESEHRIMTVGQTICPSCLKNKQAESDKGI